jgi:hypothetical protein
VLTLQIPMLLALLGTALMAVVIFAPSRVPAPPTTSFAPPFAPPRAEHWGAPPAFDAWDSPAAVDLPWTSIEDSATPAWPMLIDRRAEKCDAAARLGLVEALAAVRTPWSEAILRRALDEESDPAVRIAVAEALAA